MEPTTIESVLLSIAVVAVFFVINAILGWFLSRSKKPYGKTKLIIHILLFLLVSGGVIAALYKLQLAAGNKTFSTLFLYTAGLTLLINLVVGISMIMVKQKNRYLVFIHTLSTFIMACSIASSIVFLTLKY